MVLVWEIIFKRAIVLLSDLSDYLDSAVSVGGGHFGGAPEDLLPPVGLAGEYHAIS